jgi:quinol monooxygenase YgiN
MITLHVCVPPAKKAEVIVLFDSYVGPVSVHPDCRKANLYSNITTHYDFLLLEEWDSQRALQDHIRSDDFLKILAIMDLASKPPELRFHTVSSVEGFELVEELREKRQRPLPDVIYSSVSTADSTEKEVKKNGKSKTL